MCQCPQRGGCPDVPPTPCYAYLIATHYVLGRGHGAHRGDAHPTPFGHSSSVAVANDLIEYRAVAQKESRIEETQSVAGRRLAGCQFPAGTTWAFGATKYKYKTRSWPKIFSAIFSELAFKGR